MKNILFGSIVLFLGGCATTIRDVPKLGGQKFRSYDFGFVAGADSRVEVRDLRSAETKEHSVQLVDHVQEVMERILRKSNIEIIPSSKNLFVLMIGDRREGELSGDECVDLKGNWAFYGRASKNPTTLTATSVGCFKYENSLGMKLGTDITEAYRVALDYILDSVEAEGKKLK